MPIDSRVDIRDPLGAPETVDRSRYLEALGRLGWNADNLNSNLPMAVANMKAANELLTYNWNQQMNWQKTQADTREALARADNLNEITDFNNKTSDLRIKALDQENKQRDLALALSKNKLTVDSATMDAQIASEIAKSNQELDVAKQAHLKTQVDQDAIDRSHTALDNIDAAVAAIPDPNDPDFETKLAKGIKDNPNWQLAATDPATSARYNAALTTARTARQTSVSFQNLQARKAEVQGALSKGFLPSAYADQLDALAANPDQYHDAMARAHLAEANQQMSRILHTLQAVPDYERTPMLKTYISNIANAQNRINGMLNNEELAKHLSQARYSQWFDADGRLTPELQSELDSLDGVSAAELKEGTGKAATEQVTVQVPLDPKDPWSKENKTVIEIPRNLPAAEKQRMIDEARERLKTPEQREADAQEKARRDSLQPEAPKQQTPQAGASIYDQPTNITGRQVQTQTPQDAQNARKVEGLKTLVANNPAMAGVVDQFLHGTTEQQKAAYATLHQLLGGEAPEGFQSGGTVFQPSSLEQFPTQPPPGSTDSVPAMLTPGEFVVNQRAASQNMPLLEAINAQGNTQTGARVSSQSNIQPSSVPTSVQGVGGKQISLGAAPPANPQQQQPAGATPSQPGQTTPTTVTPWYGTGNFYGKQPTDSTTKTPQPTDDTGTSGADVAATMVTAPRSPSQVEPSSPITTTSVPGVGQTIDGAKITQYGYPGDSSWDMNSGKGIGDRKNQLQAGLSVALTQSQRQLLFPDAPVDKKTGLTYSTGKTFTWGGRTYRDDDSAPEGDNRIDVYNPMYAGLDKGVSPEVAADRAQYLPAAYRGMQMGGPVFQDNPRGGWLSAGPTGMQHGGEVAEEGSIGTGGGRGGGESELDQTPQPSMRHRRMHPRVGAPGALGDISPDIPDPMQKKLAKLSQGYLSGLSDIIRAKPELGPALLKHARHQLAANMGGQPEDWMMEGQQPGARQYAQAAPQAPPEAYGGGAEAYGMQTGGTVPPGGMVSAAGGSSVPISSIYPVMPTDASMTPLMPSDTTMIPSGSLYPILPAGGMPTSVMPPTGDLPQLDPTGLAPVAGQNDPTVDPTSFFTGTGYQKGGEVKKRGKAKKAEQPKSTLKLDDYSLAELTHAHNLITHMLARRNS